MDSPDSAALPRKGLGMGASIAIGIVATLVFSGFGALAWLLWVWTRTPDRVRKATSARKKALVLVPVALSVAASAAGFVLTVLGLVRAFDSIQLASPNDKARLLAQGISEAMNATALGMIVCFVGGVGAFVAGCVLLRASARDALMAA